jgi:osmotically-inducible protein OsmY
MVLLAVAAVLPAFNVPARASELDRRIESDARQLYVFKIYLAGDDIKIESRDGVVTLTGLIAEYFHRALAEVTIKDIPGVTGVDNRLEVKGSSPTANSDAWLLNEVKATLVFHRSVSAAATEVSVKDGVVTLRGAAASPAQKDLTAEYSKDVEGVKDVINEMTVAAAPEKRALTTGEKIDDVSISALVRMALLLHHSTSGLYTSIGVRRGVVTVDGRAKNAAQKDQVTKVVKDINGVKKVKNLMTLE